MKIINVQQGTQEWLEHRLGKFTASQAQAIATAGKGLDTLVYDKVAELLTNKKPEVYTNEDMERGNQLEDMARSAYELNTSNDVVQVGFIELNDRVGCSPDGLVGDDGLVEIKCPKDRVYVEYMHTKKIYTKYMWQMQFQLYVTGRDWCDYVVYNKNFDTSTIIARVEKDQEAQQKIISGLHKGIKKLETILKEL